MGLYEAECKGLLDRFGALKKAKETPSRASLQEDVRRFPLLGGFDLCLKCSHLFNILDARGAISVTERVGVIARIRALAVGVAKAYMEQQSAASETAEEEEKASAGA